MPVLCSSTAGLVVINLSVERWARDDARSQEMRIIADFLQIQVGDVEGGIDATMIDARLKRFKDAADLLTVARLLPAMAEALHVLVPEADFSALRHLSDATTEVSVRAMNLSRVSEQLLRVKEVTKGMEPFHVELLAGLRDKSEVVAFLKTEAVDFRPRLALIQQNLQVGVVPNSAALTHSYRACLQLRAYGVERFGVFVVFLVARRYA